MSAALKERKKPLGIRATPEQHRVILEAAEREHRSMNSFVLHAALREAAESRMATARPKRSRAELEALAREAQALMRRANPTGRSLVDELIAERREEAARG